jgi:NADH-quinone oxidoreductase subunit M
VLLKSFQIYATFAKKKTNFQPLMLSLLIFLPVIPAIAFWLLPSQKAVIYLRVTTLVAFIQLLITTFLFLELPTEHEITSLHLNPEAIYFGEKYSWFKFPLGKLGIINIEYALGVDDLNAVFLWLSALVFFVAAIASHEIKENTQSYFALFLLLNSTVFGCFAALDFFLFFLFFELMLLPMYFLIGLWGGVSREYAAIKFFIYTFLGSILILIALIALGLSVAIPVENADGVMSFQEHSLNFLVMSDQKNFIVGSLLDPKNPLLIFGFSIRSILFVTLMIGFAIKLPAVPVHTWLPDAHVEAPTPVSIILAGILLKIGGYGMIRIAYKVFPVEFADFALWICGFGILSMLYAGFVALGQSNLKKMIAYSSISHVGFALLGIGTMTQEGLHGATYQLFSHGILSSMLFFLTGVLYNRTKNLEIETYNGLVNQMPQYSFFVAIAFFASLGLPTFSGFIGEMLVLAGGFHATFLPMWAAILACFTLLIGAGYFLWTYQRIFLGKFSLKNPELLPLLTDLTPTEKAVLLLLTALAILFGLFPSIILEKLVF